MWVIPGHHASPALGMTISPVSTPVLRSLAAEATLAAKNFRQAGVSVVLRRGIAKSRVRPGRIRLQETPYFQKPFFLNGVVAGPGAD